MLLVSGDSAALPQHGRSLTRFAVRHILSAFVTLAERDKSARVSSPIVVVFGKLAGCLNTNKHSM